jgi:hypothetical protein
MKMPFDAQKLKELALPVEQAIGRALDYVAGLSPRERIIVMGGLSLSRSSSSWRESSGLWCITGQPSRNRSSPKMRN